MQVLANLDFKGVGRLIRPSIASNENMPANPQIGEFWFGNKRLYVCVEIESGVPFWVQLTQELNTYKHNQSTPALEWTVNHNLNTAIGIVQVYDETGHMVLPDDIDSSNINSTVIKFSTPSAGFAVFMYGSFLSGNPAQNVAYTEEFTNQAVWNVNHGLGFNPAITCVSNNMVVQPESIEYTDTMNATITFSRSITGSVRCV